jgi:flagellar motility protein MotE (MotC chaperone)
MEILIYFSLGILTGTLVFLLGYASLGVFRLNTKVDGLNEFIELTDRRVSEIESEFGKTLENKERDLINYVDEVQSNLNEVERDIISIMDSRFDKFENKLKDQIASSEEVRKVIDDNQLTKQRLDEFIRTYQNQ